jgi:hypothetical protein
MMTMSRTMLLSLQRSVIIGVLLAALGLLAGCSVLRLAYNQGPDWAYWWLDGYVDFNEDQSPKVRDAIGAWFKWHRNTQLPDYVRLLAQAQRDALQPLNAAQACHWIGEVETRVGRAVEHALPAVAELAHGLTPQQLQHLERKYAKNNQQFSADYLQASPAERLQASVKRVIERTEFFYGRLDDAQRSHLAQGVAASPFDAELWLAERQRRQQETLQTLRRLSLSKAPDHPELVEGLSGGEVPAGEAQVALKALIDNALHSPRPAYRAYQQRLARYNCAFAAQMHQLSTPEQRRRLALRLKGWEDDLRALAGDAIR